MLAKLIKGISSWSDLEAGIASLPTEIDRGNTFDFSHLTEAGQKSFSKYLLPEKKLRIFGNGGIAPFYYQMDSDRHHKRFNYQIQWKVYIDGGEPLTGKKPLDSIQAF